MNILIACDSFKDALPALAVCQAIERGLKLAVQSLETTVFPLGDGGEGTAEVLVFHSGGTWRTVQVHDPLFRPVSAAYGLSGDGKTAFIEMAAASGLQLLKPGERNPLKTTTIGTGELIMDAIRQGAEHLVLGIGGSSTNDVGIGMATALGYAFLDEAGQPVSPVGGHLEKVTQIDGAAIQFDRERIKVDVLCDVDNPLYGKNGAAHIYGPQKGADNVAVAKLEAGVRNLAVVLEERYYRDFSAVPGAGAAGGLGAGCLAFLGANLCPGIETVMKLTHFEEALKKADLLITGEGRLDGQTLRGKLIYGITQRAKQYRIPVVALCGSLEVNAQQIKSMGLQAAISISPGPQSLSEALDHTAEFLENTAFNVMRLWDSA